ncbi:MAG: hypothetical protein SWX82_28450 [Cyanobacteriota bacterium]|nr:hypothetical protein [Cyanobacteriota bacterium]
MRVAPKLFSRFFTRSGKFDQFIQTDDSPKVSRAKRKDIVAKLESMIGAFTEQLRFKGEALKEKQENIFFLFSS